jgi:hypothetical protein
MRMRVSLSAAMLLLTGCAGSISPPLDPAPEADSVFGILLLHLFGGFLYRMQSDKTSNTQSLLRFTYCEREICTRRIDARAIPEHDAGLVRVLNGIE